MRLNRVLQLTAGVAMAMAATIFTISCSGEDGADGRDGANKCTVSGTTVSCGGTVVGNLGSGIDGEPGGPGGPGGPGVNGTACILAGEGSFDIICGGQLKGTLSGCSLDTLVRLPTTGDVTDAEIEINCGSTAISVCMFDEKFQTYDPSKSWCDVANGKVELISDDCAGTAYNQNRQYCGYASKADFDAKRKPTVLPLCKSNYSTAIANTDKPNLAEKDAGTGVWGLASGDTWLDEYCRVEVIGLTASGTEPNIIYKLDSTMELAIAEVCGASKASKINEGSWKGEYCGYAKQSDVNGIGRTVVKNACGDGGKPDSAAFGKNYCRMEKRTSKYSTISDAITNPSSEHYCIVGTEIKTLNAINKRNLVPQDFKGEYCGYENAANFAIDKLSVLIGVCDDGKGPNADSWNNEYCQVIPRNKATGLTEIASGSAAYCMKEASANYKTAGAAARINENSWKNQYCGYTSQEAAEATEPTVLTGVCGNDVGPNAGAWNNEYCAVTSKPGRGEVELSEPSSEYCGTTAINKGTWKDEYCGYASKEAFEADPKVVSALTGSCGDGRKPNEKNNTAFGNEYCQANKTGATTMVGTTAASLFDVYCLADTTDADYGVAPASARLNEKTWKSEYCGFASKADFEAATQVFSKLTGICEDGAGPNQAEPSYSAWTNDYCQADKDGVTGKVSGSEGAKTVYCLAEGGDFATAAAQSRLNENTWKGQYCFADDAIGVCPGGQIPVAEALSTDNSKCAYEL